MNKRVIKNTFYCLFTLACCSFFACNDPASIDTNLVNIDLLDVESESDFDISSFTVVEDSVLAYEPGLVLIEKYPLGIYNDPVFGTANSSIISQLYLTTTSSPDFTGAVVDSVVMELAFSPVEPFYGDSTEILGLEVYEIAESIDAAADYYSNKQTATESSPIGSFEGVPNFRDSVPVVIYQADTLALDTLAPMLRFKLDNSFGERVITSGDDILTSPTEFLTTFKGVELRPTRVNNGMVAFDFGTFDSAATPSLNGGSVSIFYTIGGVTNQYKLAFNPNISVKYEQHQHDYSGSIVEEFLGDVIKGDSLTFIQGLSGVNTVISFNDVDKLEGAIINGASLEVYGTALNGDEGRLPLPEQLVLREELDSGILQYTRDFITAAQFGLLSNAGGVPEDIGGGIFKYTFNVGSQLQDIIEGNRPNEVYIRTSTKIANMRRAVLFGAGHSIYPMKLTVTYTKI